MQEKYRIAVLGAGNGGQAIAGHLAILGHEVRLYARNILKIKRIVKNGGIALKGIINGFGMIKTISSNLQEVVKDAHIVMVCVTADAHRAIAQKLVPVIEEEQIIILNPGRTLGAIECRQVFREKKLQKRVYVVEAQSLIYACRMEIPGTVRIIGYKKNVHCSAFPKCDNPIVKHTIAGIYQSFRLVDNILITSLENFGAIFHTVIVLFNASKIERGEDFYFYNEISPQVCSLLEKTDKERIKLAKKFGIAVKSAESWITYAYKNIEGNDFYSKIRNNPAYFKIKAPKTLFSRLLIEDIPTGILPMLELGKLVSIKLPLMHAIYELASALLNIDFRISGRTLKTLGLENISKDEFLKQL